LFSKRRNLRGPDDLQFNDFPPGDVTRGREQLYPHNVPNVAHISTRFFMEICLAA
jgi:hypothetical protein